MPQGEKKYFPQIDILKCFSIISVILVHILPISALVSSRAQFHINQTVIIFFILIGLTLGISFNRKAQEKRLKLKNLYSKEYFLKKSNRLIVPFLVVYLLSLILGIAEHKTLYFGFFTLIGLLPVTGPGNYFFSIILQYIVVAPLIFFIYKKNPKLMLALLLLVNLIFELLIFKLAIFSIYSYLYSACIFRYFFAIALGLYVSEEYTLNHRVRFFSRRNWLLFLPLPLSIYYLYIGIAKWQPWSFLRQDWGTHNVVAFPYVFFITVLFLNFNREKWLNSLVARPLLAIGKASYHIFLTQMLFFGLGFSFSKPSATVATIIADLATIIALGWLFYKSENKIRGLISSKRKMAWTS